MRGRYALTCCLATQRGLAAGAGIRRLSEKGADELVRKRMAGSALWSTVRSASGRLQEPMSRRNEGAPQVFLPSWGSRVVGRASSICGHVIGYQVHVVEERVALPKDLLIHGIQAPLLRFALRKPEDHNPRGQESATSLHATARRVKPARSGRRGARLTPDRPRVYGFAIGTGLPLDPGGAFQAAADLPRRLSPRSLGRRARIFSAGGAHRRHRTQIETGKFLLTPPVLGSQPLLLLYGSFLDDHPARTGAFLA